VVFLGVVGGPFVEGFVGVMGGAHAGASGHSEDDDLGIGAAVDPLEEGAEAGVIRVREHGGVIGDPFAGDGGIGRGLGGQGPDCE